MPSCHSYQIQRNRHSAQYRFYFLAKLKTTCEKSLMFYTHLKNKQKKKLKVVPGLPYESVFLNSQIKSEVFTILRYYQTRNSRWNSSVYRLSRGRTVVIWHKSAKCHYYRTLPLLLEKEHVFPHPWWDGMVTRRPIKAAEQELVEKSTFLRNHQPQT